MCSITEGIIVNVELVKTLVDYSLSITPKASKAFSCFGSAGKKKSISTKENKTKEAPSWGIPVLKELVLCTEQ